MPEILGNSWNLKGDKEEAFITMTTTQLFPIAVVDMQEPSVLIFTQKKTISSQFLSVHFLLKAT